MDVEIKSFDVMLPAKPGRCPICAHHHRPDDPHNRYSLYYQMNFYQQHGRWPNWADAMAHCDEPTKQAWMEGLLGARVQPGEFVSHCHEEPA